jgi:hypothetical protein
MKRVSARKFYLPQPGPATLPAATASTYWRTSGMAADAASQYTLGCVNLHSGGNQAAHAWTLPALTLTLPFTGTVLLCYLS